ncbi:MAG: hypothetical protein AB4062_13945 [Crocosphaera sp.]
MKPLIHASLVSAFFWSLSYPVLGSTLVTPNQPFSSEFIAFSDNVGRGVSSHGPSTIQFEQTAERLTTNFTEFGFPDIFVTSESNQLDSSNWTLNLVYETGTNNGFIPPEIFLAGQPINQWVIDLGSFFSNENLGIQLNQPVEYNSATISWFDDGNVVFEESALNRILLSSSPTNLMGQFIISGSPTFDLGAFGNGIDQANITVEVTVTSVPESSINLPFWLVVLGFIGMSRLCSNAKSKVV